MSVKKEPRSMPTLEFNPTYHRWNRCMQLCTLGTPKFCRVPYSIRLQRTLTFCCSLFKISHDVKCRCRTRLPGLPLSRLLPALMADGLPPGSVRVSSPWGPGLIGLTLSAFMYGAGFGQSLFYVHYFPGDRTLLKMAVMITLAMDTVHIYGCAQLYWQLLVVCHHNLSSECQTHLPLPFSLAVILNYFITFTVQCFYVQRVWIISGNHKLITILVVITAIVEFIIGLVCSVQTFQHQTIQYIFTTPLIAYSAIASTICDAIITISVVYFLRAGRPKVKLRRARFVQQLTKVTINMGLLTCVISLTTAILHAFQGENYWVEISGVILSRSYVNSMLAVLNARKSIRDSERDSHDQTIEIPSIQII
ncbi:hypothetical protein BDN67DRAFT_1000152 [Paxillus ammoniavirescens]|nr:hypothetical protein BDN67DRAFT_1000152 [Paxillus ammoniavirescens]